MSSRIVEPLASDAIVGSYRVLQKIGDGGFALTYRVEEAGDGLHRAQPRTLALKEFFPRGAIRDGQVVRPLPGAEHDFQWGATRFLQEALILQNVRHPNIVAVEGIFLANGTIYMVMDFVEGGTLLDAIEANGAMSMAAITAWAVPLLEALDYLHTPNPKRAQAITKSAAMMKSYMDANGAFPSATLDGLGGEVALHLDISPTNIMMGPHGPVLIDFGAVRHRDLTTENFKISRTVETVGYTAPEVSAVLIDHIGPRADLYSLAACIHLAATGNSPPPPAEREDTLRNSNADPLPSLALGRNSGNPMARGADSALQLSRNKRPVSARAWLDLVKGKAPPAIDPKPKPQGKRVLPMAVIAAIAALGVLALGWAGWVATHGEATAPGPADKSSPSAHLASDFAAARASGMWIEGGWRVQGVDCTMPRIITLRDKTLEINSGGRVTRDHGIVIDAKTFAIEARRGGALVRYTPLDRTTLTMTLGVRRPPETWTRCGETEMAIAAARSCDGLKTIVGVASSKNLTNMIATRRRQLGCNGLKAGATANTALSATAPASENSSRPPPDEDKPDMSGKTPEGCSANLSVRCTRGGRD